MLFPGWQAAKRRIPRVPLLSGFGRHLPADTVGSPTAAHSRLNMAAVSIIGGVPWVVVAGVEVGGSQVRPPTPVLAAAATFENTAPEAYLSEPASPCGRSAELGVRRCCCAEG